MKGIDTKRIVCHTELQETGNNDMATRQEIDDATETLRRLFIERDTIRSKIAATQAMLRTLKKQPLHENGLITGPDGVVRPDPKLYNYDGEIVRQPSAFDENGDPVWEPS
jgi:hypothetical protein